jgi:BASS family bile acid:Na+ symporter
VALRALAWLGRHGAAVLAGGLLIGLALPPLAALLRPALAALVFVLTTVTMLTIEWPQVLVHLRRPARVALILGWSLVAVPLLVAAAARLLPLPAPLAQAVVLWAAAPPLTSVAALAIILGLDPALALIAMIGGTFLVPLTLPPLVLGLIGLEIDIGMLPLMLRLALFVGGAAAAAAAIRRLAGPERLRRHAVALSGANVLFMLVFAVAIMDGVDDILVARPLDVLLYAGTALVASVALQAASFLAFSRLERRAALTVGLVGGNHNLAMVWANLGGAATPDLMLFFICVQLPIYVLPAALKPIYRRLGGALG